MKKFFRGGVSALLALALAFSCAAAVFADDAATTYTVQLEVTYGQTTARTMLAMINEFRAGDDAWYWNSDDTTKTTCSNLGTLTYDYALEKAAMQRAAEIALCFSHTRPNGTTCSTTYRGINGENIAAGAGMTTARAAFTLWQEKDENYSGQGHRRNMLGSAYTAVGIGHVVCNGIHYWVQEFGYAASDTTEVTACDESKAVTIEMADPLVTKESGVEVTNQLTSEVTASQTEVTLEAGQSADLPTVTGKAYYTALGNLGNGTWPRSDRTVEVLADWSTSDTSIAAVENGKLVAKKAGSTSLTTTALGKTVTVPVTVTAISIVGATVTVNPTSVSYTGEAQTPTTVTVTLNGTTLTKDTDYTLTYSNNTAVGTATVTVTGTGKYTGTATATFTITECSHQWNEGTVTTQPTCTTAGEKTYTCTLCNTTKTESVAALGHDWATSWTSDANGHWHECQRTGCTETKGDAAHVSTDPGDCTKQEVCTVCSYVVREAKAAHSYANTVDAKYLKTAATCTESAVYYQSCTDCGKQGTETFADGSALGHSWGPWISDSARARTLTCTRTCTRCNETETEACTGAAAVKENEVAPTCTEVGSHDEVVYCARCGQELSRETKTDAALGHDYTAVVTAPTCTTDGYTTYTCTRCSDSYVGDQTAAGHSWSDWAQVTDGCMSYDKRTCAKCGMVETQNMDTAAHTWDTDYTADQLATCTEDGSESIHCSKCGATQPGSSRTIEKLGHSFTQYVSQGDATCTDPGTKIAACDNGCGTKDTQPGDALGHDWQSQVIAPTCLAEGYTLDTCSRCQLTQKHDTTAKLDHQYTVLEHDDTSHWYRCATCTATQPAEEHTFGDWVLTQAATCAAQGSEQRTCEVCGFAETRATAIDPDAHSYPDEWSVTLSATVDAEGEEKKVCLNGCGAVLTQSIAKLTPTPTPTAASSGEEDDTASSSEESSSSSSEKAAATATPAPTATPVDTTQYYVCVACGYHNWTAEGSVYRCDNCGHTVTANLAGYPNVKGTATAAAPAAAAAAPAKAATASTIPQTSDSSNPALWAVLCIVGLLGMAGVTYAKHRDQ